MPRVVPSLVVELIDRAFPWAAAQEAGKTYRIMAESDGVLSAIVSMVDAIPADLVALVPADYSSYITAIWTIRAQIDSWRLLGKSGSMDKIAGIDRRNPVTVLRMCLAKCPDESPSVTTKEFSYVTDLQLRQSLLADLGAVSRALANGEWKAATVLGGACLESLLLWAATAIKDRDSVEFAAAEARAVTRQLKKKPPSILDRWDLYQLIEVCLDLTIITPSTATQARLAKDFRNLIHPGAAQRRAADCNVGTAMAARAALEFVARDLAKAFS